MPVRDAHRASISGVTPLVAVVVTLLCVSACASVPLEDPPPIVAAATPEQTRTAISRALVRGQWLVEYEEPGKIITRLDRPAWGMTVEIVYDREIRLRYSGSRHLDYQRLRGIPHIHQTYNTRAMELMREIAREIELLRIAPLPAG